MALALTTTFVCPEPVDGLVPESGHMSISPLFFSQVAFTSVDRGF